MQPEITLEQLVSAVRRLDPSGRAAVADALAEAYTADYAPSRTLPEGVLTPAGVAGRELLLFAGTIESEALEAMTIAIHEGCEQVTGK